MTLHSVMEVYHKHPPGSVIIRAPQFIPAHPRARHTAAAAVAQNMLHARGMPGLPLAFMSPLLPHHLQQHQQHQHQQQKQHKQQLPGNISGACSPEKPSSSFSIADILNGTTKRNQSKNTDTSTTTQTTTPASSNTSPSQDNVCIKRGVVRPWDHDTSCSRSGGSRSSRSCSPAWDDTTGGEVGDDDEEIDVGEEKPRTVTSQGGKSKNSPLDALFQMTSKTFEGLDSAGLLNAGD